MIGRRGRNSRRLSAMVQDLIASLSYPGLLLVLLLGSLGVPIPEEAAIIAAAVLSYERVMRWWLALPTCIVGVATGDIVLYWVGRRYGETVLERPLFRRFLGPARLEQVRVAYRRRGATIVFLARHVVGLRAAAFIGAGVVRLPLWKFLLADGVAISYGVPLSFTLAYLFTRHLHAVIAEVHRVELWIALVALVASAIYIYVALRRRSRRAFVIAAQPMS